VTTSQTDQLPADSPSAETDCSPDEPPFVVGEVVECCDRVYANMAHGQAVTVMSCRRARETRDWVVRLDGFRGDWLAASFRHRM
jgi:hypothetical protein